MSNDVKELPKFTNPMVEAMVRLDENKKVRLDTEFMIYEYAILGYFESEEGLKTIEGLNEWLIDEFKFTNKLSKHKNILGMKYAIDHFSQNGVTILTTDMFYTKDYKLHIRNKNGVLVSETENFVYGYEEIEH